MGRETVPDAEKHQISAKEGFDNEDILAIALQVLQASKIALVGDRDVQLLAPLKVMLQKRETPAHKLIQVFNRVGSIQEALLQTYLSS